jgi:hypothetical protein
MKTVLARAVYTFGSPDCSELAGIIILSLLGLLGSAHLVTGDQALAAVLAL